MARFLHVAEQDGAVRREGRPGHLAVDIAAGVALFQDDQVAGDRLGTGVLGPAEQVVGGVPVFGEHEGAVRGDMATVGSVECQVEAGTELIHEGERGRGLFLVLAGEVEVVARADTPEAVSLARLKPGDIFGEMSLVTDQPTSATVRATMRSSVLFLAREYVERLAEAIPQVQAYFEQVALNRARDNTMRFDRGALPSEAIEVDLSDVVLV